MSSAVASDIPHPPDSDSEDQILYKIIAWVTFHPRHRTPLAKGKKSKTTMAKEIRIKEFIYLFAPTKVNYVVFLQRHHLLQYTVVTHYYSE
jgi:hypothetical protein